MLKEHIFFGLLVIILFSQVGCAGKSTYQIEQERKQEVQKQAVLKEAQIRKKITARGLLPLMYVKEETKTSEGKTVPKGYHVRILDINNEYALTNKGTVPINSLEKERKEFKLSIDAPNGAKIQIVNLECEYTSDMWLPRGKYNIKATKNGLRTYENIINLDSDKSIKIEMPKDYLTLVEKIVWETKNEPFFQLYDQKTNLIWALQTSYVDYIDRYNPSITTEVIAYPRRGLVKVKPISTIFEYRDKLYLHPADFEVRGITKGKFLGNLSHFEIGLQTVKWDIPEFDTVETSNPFKKYQKYFRNYELGYSCYNIGIQTSYEKYFGLRYSCGQPTYKDLKFIACKNNSFYNGILTEGIDGHYPIVIPVRPLSTEYDTIIFDQRLSPINKLEKLTTKLTEEDLYVHPVKSSKKIDKKVSVQAKNDSDLEITRIQHTDEETAITMNYRGHCSGCFLNTSGKRIFTLNNEPFKYFILNQKKYPYVKNDYNSITYYGGEVTYVYDRLHTKQFTLVEGSSDSWKFVNVDSYIPPENTFFEPIAPSYIKTKPLNKGEFETTAEFDKRKKEEERRIDKINQKISQEYQEQLIQFNDELYKAKILYDNAIEKNKKSDTIKKVASAAASRAFNMIFGDPKFKNIKYNADKEYFDATLYSHTNNFSMNIKIPVKRTEARLFKSKLMDNRLVPQVIFEVNNGKLEFKSVDIVSNVEKQRQDFEFAKTIHTTTGYENFIKKYSEGKYAEKARSEIAKIQKSEEEARLRSEREAKERAKREAERKERERQAYMKPKYVGEQVCQDGSMFFGLINPTIRGYVEDKQGNRIQIRISDTEGTDPHYNGVTLYRNTLIWDSYYEWKHCE